MATVVCTGRPPQRLQFQVGQEGFDSSMELPMEDSQDTQDNEVAREDLHSVWSAPQPREGLLKATCRRASAVSVRDDDEDEEEEDEDGELSPLPLSLPLPKSSGGAPRGGRGRESELSQSSADDLHGHSTGSLSAEVPPLPAS